MRTREEGRAAREAALREARHSIPVSGIIVGAIAFAALGYFGWQIWDQNVRSPGYITRQYIAAWQKKDWPTMKSLSTAESVPWIDAWAKRVQESAGKGDLPMKIQEFEETEFRIDSVSVEDKGNTATVVMRKSRRTVLLSTQQFFLVKLGETWKVDVPKSTQGENNPIYGVY